MPIIDGPNDGSIAGTPSPRVDAEISRLSTDEANRSRFMLVMTLNEMIVIGILRLA